MFLENNTMRVIRDFLYVGSVALVIFGIMFLFLGLGILAVYTILIGAIGICGA
jgi:hypothetical protein